MRYTQITIQASEQEQEQLIGLLTSLDVTGFEQTDTHLIAYFNEENFPSYEVNSLLKDYSFHLTNIEEQNWNSIWESNFQPVIVENFCGIRAHFHDKIKDVAHEITITPKMSFGTGHHATTYMMIQQIKDLDFKNKVVFDFGTGTGILAILAEKLGAASISAIDNDEWSINNTIENIENNHCNKIDVKLSAELPKDHRFDIILANINKNVILQYLSELKSILSNDGKILFSGLLMEDEHDIVEACKQVQLSLLRQMMKNNWISLLFEVS